VHNRGRELSPPQVLRTSPTLRKIESSPPRGLEPRCTIGVESYLSLCPLRAFRLEGSRRRVCVRPRVGQKCAKVLFRSSLSLRVGFPSGGARCSDAAGWRIRGKAGAPRSLCPPSLPRRRQPRRQQPRRRRSSSRRPRSWRRSRRGRSRPIRKNPHANRMALVMSLPVLLQAQLPAGRTFPLDSPRPWRRPRPWRWCSGPAGRRVCS
jgi:hypothetical protein